MTFDEQRPGEAVLPDDRGRAGPAPEGAQCHPPAQATESCAARFGVFRRYRSPSGADVFPRGLPTRGARPIELATLEEALSRRWDDDRHFVLYTSSRPYRINNGALGAVRAEVRLLALDVDNHSDTPGWMEGERAKIAALLARHPGGFIHSTRRGWRALYALPVPFPVRSEADKDGFALWYARVAAYFFERFGIVADDALTRWNQPIRLPHVVRDGHVYDAEVVAGDARSLGAFALPDDVPSTPDLRALAAVLPRWGSVAKRWEPRRAAFRIGSAAFDHVPLPPYAERVAAAESWAREEAPRAVERQGGRAKARSVAATLHVGFAIHRDDVARILMGPYNRRRCSPPWSEEEIDDLRGIAQAVARAPVNPWGFMLSRDRTGIEAARAALAAAAEARNVVALDDVAERLVDAVERHRAVVLRATYGAGKTYAISRYIATRTTGRVIVIVPRHEVARAWVESLSAAGEDDVAHHASVVQRRDEDGRRHCDNKVALKLYKQGGDVARDVCPSCPRAQTCPAYTTRPNAKARVHVLPRELIPSIEITDEDLVVFDDAAVDLVAWHRLSVRQLRRLDGADVRMLPTAQLHLLRIFLVALLAGPRGAEETARLALLAASLDAPGANALRYVAAQLVEGQRSPRVPRDALAEGGDELAETLRDVGRLRQVLRFAAACAEGAEVCWSEESRTVHGESAAATLLRAHAGRLVVLDGAANVEELRALRSDLHIERLDVDDAGDASRLLLFAKHANRTALRETRQRRALLDQWLGGVLEHLTTRKARRPVFVVYKTLEAELRTHPAIVAWCADDPERDVRVAHYGALRGSNRFRGRDSVVTLGDPWLNGDDVIGRADRLGLDEPSYRVALATAELGQAHGRSRSVRRRKRLTHVHVGRLVPDGWGHGVVVEPFGGPPERERTHGAPDRLEFGALIVAMGGNRAAAPLLGCHASTIAGWRGGRRGLPRDVLARARELVAAHAKRTVSSGEPGAGGGPSSMDAPPCKDDQGGRVHAVGLSQSEEAELAASVERCGGSQEGGGPRGSRPLPEENEPSPLGDGSRFEGERVVACGALEKVTPLPPEPRSGEETCPLGVLDRSLCGAWGDRDMSGGGLSFEGVSGGVTCEVGLGMGRVGAQEARGPAVRDAARGDPPVVLRGVSGAAFAGPLSFAAGAARLVAAVEQVERGDPATARAPPPMGPERVSRRTFNEDELALLLEAQERARRRFGLGP